MFDWFFNWHSLQRNCGKWLSDMDSNHDKGLQRALCYHYTIGQTGMKLPFQRAKRKWRKTYTLDTSTEYTGGRLSATKSQESPSSREANTFPLLVPK